MSQRQTELAGRPPQVEQEDAEYLVRREEVLNGAEEVRNPPNLLSTQIINLQKQPGEYTPEDLRGGKMVRLGAGEEGTAYLFHDAEKAESYATNGPHVLKVFHDRVGDGSRIPEDEMVSELARMAILCAGNIRYARTVFNPDGIAALLNARDAELAGLGYIHHHLRDYRRSFPQTERLRTTETTTDYWNWLSWYVGTHLGLAQKLGSQYYQQVIQPRIDNVYSIIEQEKGFIAGGFGDYINWMLQVANEQFSDPFFTTPTSQGFIPIPQRAFPVVEEMGRFPSDHPNKDLAGKLYTVTELIPTVLEREIESSLANLEAQVATAERRVARNERVARLRNSVVALANFPQNRFTDLYLLLSALNSLRLVVCDMTEGNAGIDRWGNTILLDTSAIQEEGTQHLIATTELLPGGADGPYAEAYMRGELWTDRGTDFQTLQILQQEIQAQFHKTAAAGLSVDDYRQDRGQRTVKKRRARSRLMGLIGRG